MKKYNNDSDNIAEWTTKKLKQEAREYDSIIHGQHACYGSSDILILDSILNELDNRGIEITTKLDFY